MRTEAREMNKGQFLRSTGLPPKESGPDILTAMGNHQIIFKGLL